MSQPGNRAVFHVADDPIPDSRAASGNEREDLLGGTRPDVGGGRILVSGGDGFDGYEIMAYHGICWGISVRAKDVGQDCLMACKNLTGGELQSYAELGDEARQRALDRMFQSARRQGANGIIHFRFEISPMTGGGAATVAHGTSVSIRPIPNYVPTGAAGTLLHEIAQRLPPAS